MTQWPQPDARYLSSDKLQCSRAEAGRNKMFREAGAIISNFGSGTMAPELSVVW